MFSENPYKQHYLARLGAAGPVTLYRSGPFVDLCRGPHVRSTGQVGAILPLQSSRAYWLGDAAAAQLSRVYGMAQPTDALLRAWHARHLAAKSRDHRVIGRQQGLFMVHAYSPGSAFMLKHGTRIYNRLMAYVRGLYREHDYDEVITPQLYNKALWETSGHWQNYKDNMFCVHDHGHYGKEGAAEATAGEEFALKPMNCPGHCLIFAR